MQELTNESHGDENYKDIVEYDGDLTHLKGYSTEAASFAQMELQIADGDNNGTSAQGIIDVIDDCPHIRSELFSLINNARASGALKRTIERIEQKLAENYDNGDHE